MQIMTTSDIPDDQPLSSAETALIRWLLNNGSPQAKEYLPQLERAHVVSRCGCGCASIDLAIDGKVPPRANGIHILADYECALLEANCSEYLYSSVVACLLGWKYGPKMGLVRQQYSQTLMDYGLWKIIKAQVTTRKRKASLRLT